MIELTKHQVSSNVLISTNLIFYLSIITKGCATVLTYDTDISQSPALPSLTRWAFLHQSALPWSSFLQISCGSEQAAISLISVSNLNGCVVCANTRVIPTAWYPRRILFHNQKDFMFERFYEKCNSNSRTLNISLAEYLWKRLGEYLQLFGLLLQISHFA